TMAVVGKTGGQVLISVIGKNLSNGDVDIFQALLTTSEPITSSIDLVGSGSRDWITIRDRSGKIVDKVLGDEVEGLSDIDLTFTERLYTQEERVYCGSKNKVVSMFEGNSFKNKGDVIGVIGTNGTDKSNSLATKSEMNLPYKYLLFNENNLLKVSGAIDGNGDIVLEKNIYADSYNRTYKTFCLDVKTTNGEGSLCRTIPALAKSSIEWTEGDANNIKITSKRCSDIWERDDFWTEVYGQKAIESYVKYGFPHAVQRDELANSPKLFNLNCVMSSKEIYVDYILNCEYVDDSYGEAGQLACVINKNREIIIYIKGEVWDKELSLTSAFAFEGNRIKSTEIRDKGQWASVNTFVVIDKELKAVKFSTDTKSNKYYAKVLDLDLNTGIFE
ncbi:MAG: hypothetical protein ACRC6B_12000, partial [Fusobacteriaceae bacterium]